jgi:hypothetical protein
MAPSSEGQFVPDPESTDVVGQVAKDADFEEIFVKPNPMSGNEEARPDALTKEEYLRQQRLQAEKIGNKITPKPLEASATYQGTAEHDEPKDGYNEFGWGDKLPHRPGKQPFEE